MIAHVKRPRLAGRRRAAFHEAGHAVIYTVLSQRKILDVTLAPKAQVRFEHTEFHGAFDCAELEAWQTEATACLGGVAAEEIATGRRLAGSLMWWLTEGLSDDKALVLALDHIFGPDEVPMGAPGSGRPHLRRHYHDRARRLLEQPAAWAAVQRLAHELVTRETVPGDEVARIVREERFRATHAKRAAAIKAPRK